MTDRDDAPVAVTHAHAGRISSLAGELAFASFLASAIPAIMSAVLTTVLPTGDDRLAAGTTFGIFGLVSLVALTRRYDAPALASPTDLAWSLRRHAAWLIALACTAMTGQFFLVIRLVAGYGWRLGFTSVSEFLIALAGCATVLAAVGGWTALRFREFVRGMPPGAFWLGYPRDVDGTLLLTRLQLAMMGAAILFALTCPAATCYLISIDALP
jgi:hypothetical protein